MEKRYTDEINIQILIALLKAHNIKRVIVNPGTTNISLVASLQMDDFFEIHSCVDERSAAYMACGMAAQTGEPVVLTCTGATASRNYAPGLTEAFYRKLPVIAITASQHLGRIGQNMPQVLDRSVQFKDLVKKSVTIDVPYTNEDKWECNLKVNDALLECVRDGGGPVHINMVTTYSNCFDCKELPKQRIIKRILNSNEFPEINTDRVAIFIGNHNVFEKSLTTEIEKFCEKYNGVVLCDHTSNYYGKYKVLGSLICSQNAFENLRDIDLVIDLGNISGSGLGFKPKEIWRINPDGEIRDTLKKLTYIFQMNEIQFFKKYNELNNNQYKTTNEYEKCKEIEMNLTKKIKNIDLPYSNPWIVKNTIEKIQEDSIVHLAILNTLRSWNYFYTDKKIEFFSNTGGFGIDGILSTAVGASFCTDKLVYCFIGDLAFFYDLNAIGNKEVKNNLRIMLINNGCGTEFHNYNNRAPKISKEYGISLEYISAEKHFGNKSRELVKHYVQDLGFEYISACNKEEFKKNIDKFTCEKNNKPILYEVFTDSDDESEAIRIMNTLEVSKEGTAKNIAKKILGEKGFNNLKNKLGK